jgi:hypothetical protein
MDKMKEPLGQGTAEGPMDQHAQRARCAAAGGGREMSAADRQAGRAPGEAATA